MRFSDLSNTALALETRYCFQPMIGFYNYLLEIGASAEKLAFDDSDIRDGPLFNLNLSAHKRFSERLNANFGTGAEKRTAYSKNIFEWERYSLFLNSQYKWSEDVRLSVGYSFVKGDQFIVTTSTAKVHQYSPVYKYAPIANQNLATSKYANAKAPYPVFGQRSVYRLPAHANTFNTSINYRINSNNKMDIGMQYEKINAEGNQQYDATQVHLSWLHRF